MNDTPTTIDDHGVAIDRDRVDAVGTRAARVRANRGDVFLDKGGRRELNDSPERESATRSLAAILRGAVHGSVIFEWPTCGPRSPDVYEHGISLVRRPRA